MKKAPNLFSLGTLQCDVNENLTQIKNGDWVPARPLGLFSLRNRFKLAWAVFTGKYDAVKWPGGQ